MYVHYYFDLIGTSSERAKKVKEYGETLKKACEKMECKFHGIWGPACDKYHYVAMIGAETMVEGMRPFMETERPEELFHIEFKFFGKVYP
jgi:coproporphyrinogen III oxidase